MYYTMQRQMGLVMKAEDERFKAEGSRLLAYG